METQPLNLRYKHISDGYSFLKHKADDKPTLKSGSERVNEKPFVETIYAPK